jgi:hypothetical protein
MSSRAVVKPSASNRIHLPTKSAAVVDTLNVDGVSPEEVLCGVTSRRSPATGQPKQPGSSCCDELLADLSLVRGRASLMQHVATRPKFTATAKHLGGPAASCSSKRHHFASRWMSFAPRWP